MSAETVVPRTTDIDRVEYWLSEFATGLASKDGDAIRELLVQDSYWRDLLALSWGINTYYGIDQIADFVSNSPLAASDIELDLSSPPQRLNRSGTDCIEAVYRFKTSVGVGHGVIRFIEHGTRLYAWTVSTALESFDDFPESLGEHRPSGTEYSRVFNGPNWLDKRNEEREYKDRSPAVLIVGGGQAGLGVAARLRQLGVDGLIVDSMQRIGDNWRKRYHSLTLHNEVWVTHLPYMPFPDTWPTYVPKDKLANFFESYVDAMELNFWTETEFLGAEFDQETGRWNAKLRRGDGSECTLNPRHIIMANGVSGVPSIPELPGAAEYGGELFHSSKFTDASKYAGKRVAVLGTGTSGHDLAHELYSNGAEVTMIQRGKTGIANVGPDYAGRVYALYGEDRTTAECDLITISSPFPLVRRGYQVVTRALMEAEKNLHNGLRSIGFQINYGEDDTGFQMMYLQRGGGYYLNVGCSDLLVERKIQLIQFSDIDCLVKPGIRMNDGTTLEFDAIVTATGFHGQDTVIRQLFGDDVTSKVGPVWGFGATGELRNMWRATEQQGLWFTAGSLTQSRIFSHFLALQIKALEEGLVTDEQLRDSPAGAVRERDLIDVRDAAHVSV